MTTSFVKGNIIILNAVIGTCFSGIGNIYEGVPCSENFE